MFQKPNPFPKSIYDNVVFGPRLQGIRKRSALDAIVEDTLRRAALWDEVKDRLTTSALGLSGGHSNGSASPARWPLGPRCCLWTSRAALSIRSRRQKIEDLIDHLKREYTIVIVTHNLQQAARVSDKTAFFYMGKLIEYNDTSSMFTNPGQKQTEDYLTGRFG